MWDANKIFGKSMVDLRGEQQDSVDQSVLQGYLQQLVGQPFLQFQWSYLASGESDS